MPTSHVPYSKEGLERLASALNVSTSYLWVSPVNNTFSLRDHKSSSIKRQSIGMQQIIEEEEESEELD